MWINRRVNDACQPSVMLIQELSEQDSLDLVSRVRFGRLGCAANGQPYVVPMNFAVQDRNIYAFSTIGKKIEYLRLNPRICLQVDEISTGHKWRSVVVLGCYHEVSNMAEEEAERATIHALLQKRAAWWEPAYARTVLGGHVRSLAPIYFRISIDSITGHIATD
jgi:nitroimidazol reductase NimA-like FMN-containing flavoprotein (pyridoxamine 5'-phosphate oxidase superfamily)